MQRVEVCTRYGIGVHVMSGWSWAGKAATLVVGGRNHRAGHVWACPRVANKAQDHSRIQAHAHLIMQVLSSVHW